MAVLGAVRGGRGYAAKARISQWNRVVLDVPRFLRGAGASMEFRAGGGGRSKSISEEHGTIAGRGMPWATSGDIGWRCAAYSARVRRAGVERDGGTESLEDFEYGPIAVCRGVKFRV